jgi:hypothetical protein
MGPQNFTCKEHERVIFGPEQMLVVPPRNYCTIKNPVLRFSGKNDKNEKEIDQNAPINNKNQGNVVLDEFGNVSEQIANFLSENRTSKAEARRQRNTL